MDSKELQQLLGQPESTVLEFKQELYLLKHPDKAAANRQRDEMIKDILSLANGNAATVDEKAYLIIGADNILQTDGTRKLFDVDPNGLTQQQIMHTVNSACSPRIEEIEVETVELEGKRILVITVGPTPHLHETTQKLITPKTTYTEHVVFIRNNEDIVIASAKEREAILKLKQLYFADTRKAPPVKFGAVVGALVGGTIATMPPDKTVKFKKEVAIGRAVGGSIVGMLFGAGMGWTFTNLAEIRYEWQFTSNRGRLVWVVTFIGLLTTVWNVLKWLWQSLSILFARTKNNE